MPPETKMLGRVLAVLMFAACFLLGAAAASAWGADEPYTVTPAGVTTLDPLPAHGHVNVRTDDGTTYGLHLDPNNGHPGAAWIGETFIPWSAFGIPDDSCIVWVQLSTTNYHYGEGGEPPVCLKETTPCPSATPTPSPEPTTSPTPEPTSSTSAPEPEPSAPASTPASTPTSAPSLSAPTVAPTPSVSSSSPPPTSTPSPTSTAAAPVAVRRAPSTLAETGSATGPLALVGVILLLGGAGAWLAARSRRAWEAEQRWADEQIDEGTGLCEHGNPIDGPCER